MMSSCPDQRASSAWQPATREVKRVVCCSVARVRSLAVMSAGTVNWWIAPAPGSCPPRGRSSGSACVTEPVNCFFQYAM
ncbi:hypothetical protein SMD44_08940 [Streptomyces alboflavus]|uniref:Uncharacterized protein n=1 Tax=Streptomyces alboflavus TaxID=67267 RepID=A0A1Z1WSN6_9ACTN|nr:hypothetical protein SMD44_08940 [Streptomyces alboflavus]